MVISQLFSQSNPRTKVGTLHERGDVFGASIGMYCKCTKFAQKGSGRMFLVILFETVGPPSP